jgi:hypothetical protein
VLGRTPQDAWLAELAHRLFGDRGPKVVTEDAMRPTAPPSGSTVDSR